MAQRSVVPEDDGSLGWWVRARREALGLTYKETGLSSSKLSAIENNRRHPSRDSKPKLLDALVLGDTEWFEEYEKRRKQSLRDRVKHTMRGEKKIDLRDLPVLDRLFVRELFERTRIGTRRPWASCHVVLGPCVGEVVGQHPKKETVDIEPTEVKYEHLDLQFLVERPDKTEFVIEQARPQSQREAKASGGREVSLELAPFPEGRVRSVHRKVLSPVVCDLLLLSERSARQDGRDRSDSRQRSESPESRDTLRQLRELTVRALKDQSESDLDVLRSSLWTAVVDSSSALLEGALRRASQVRSADILRVLDLNSDSNVAADGLAALRQKLLDNSQPVAMRVHLATVALRVHALPVTTLHLGLSLDQSTRRRGKPQARTPVDTQQVLRLWANRQWELRKQLRTPDYFRSGEHFLEEHRSAEGLLISALRSELKPLDLHPFTADADRVALSAARLVRDLVELRLITSDVLDALLDACEKAESVELDTAGRAALVRAKEAGQLCQSQRPKVDAFLKRSRAE